MPPKTETQNSRKNGSVSGTPVTRDPLFPRMSLNQAIKIPKAIWEQNGGSPFALLDLASAIGRSPRSSAWEIELAAAARYGLTDASTRSSKMVGLTTLGRNVVAPSVGVSVNACLRQALLTPPLFQRFYMQFDGRPIPERSILRNTLANPTNGYGLTPEGADAFLDVIFRNIQELGLEQDFKGSKYLRLDRLAASSMAGTTISVNVMEESSSNEGIGQDEKTQEQPAPVSITRETPPAVQAQKRQIFVAHGKNRKPLEQLEKILKEYELPYVVAVNEAHKGRPIGAKVAELMRQCTSGVFICTADEEATDANGTKFWRPSDNVVYELGAASVIYGDKIVIFREDGVRFGSDFSALGHITFDKDHLDAKGLDLLKELKGLGFLKFTLT